MITDVLPVSEIAVAWQRAWRLCAVVAVVLALWLLPATALAVEWTPILRSESPAPGAPGRTVRSIDIGQYNSSAPPLIDENGRLIFLAWIDGAPADESAGRLYQWTSAAGLSLQPPAPLSQLEAGCEFGVDTFVTGQNGTYALHARSVGERFGCSAGALLIRDGAEFWSELFPTPEPDTGAYWEIRGAGPLGINRHSEVLVHSLEHSVCPPDATICSNLNRDVLFLADLSGATAIYRETAAAPGVAGDARLGPLSYQYAIDGPNELGQVVVAVPVYMDGASTQAIYRFDPDAGLELIALAGNPTPGIPGAVLEFVGAPLVDDVGAITFWRRLAQGDEVTESNDDAVWTRSPAGVTELRFRESASTGPVDLPLRVNEVGGVAFVTSGPGISGDLLWGPDREGNLAIRAREGDPVPEPMAGTLRAF